MDRIGIRENLVLRSQTIPSIHLGPISIFVPAALHGGGAPAWDGAGLPGVLPAFRFPSIRKGWSRDLMGGRLSGGVGQARWETGRMQRRSLFPRFLPPPPASRGRSRLFRTGNHLISEGQVNEPPMVRERIRDRCQQVIDAIGDGRRLPEFLHRNSPGIRRGRASGNGHRCRWAAPDTNPSPSLRRSSFQSICRSALPLSAHSLPDSFMCGNGLP